MEYPFIERDTWYLFSGVILRNYYGLKLSTTTHSNVVVLENDDQVDWENVGTLFFKDRYKDANEKHQKKLCCPSINNVLAEFVFRCSYLNCFSKVTILPSKKVVRCPSCSRIMKPDKCVKDFYSVIEFDNLCLTLLEKILSRYFKENLNSYTENIV